MHRPGLSTLFHFNSTHTPLDIDKQNSQIPPLKDTVLLILHVECTVVKAPSHGQPWPSHPGEICSCSATSANTRELSAATTAASQSRQPYLRWALLLLHHEGLGHQDTKEGGPSFFKLCTTGPPWECKCYFRQCPHLSHMWMVTLTTAPTLTGTYSDLKNPQMILQSRKCFSSILSTRTLKHTEVS